MAAVDERSHQCRATKQQQRVAERCLRLNPLNMGRPPRRELKETCEKQGRRLLLGCQGLCDTASERFVKCTPVYSLSTAHSPLCEMYAMAGVSTMTTSRDCFCFGAMLALKVQVTTLQRSVSCGSALSTRCATKIWSFADCTLLMNHRHTQQSSGARWVKY